MQLAQGQKTKSACDRRDKGNRDGKGRLKQQVCRCSTSGKAYYAVGIAMDATNKHRKGLSALSVWSVSTRVSRMLGGLTCDA